MDCEEVYSTNIEYQTHIIKDMLEESNIPVFILNQFDVSYQFGEYKITVQYENGLSVKQLLNKGGFC